MEFPKAFWEGSVDYFGAAVPGGPAARGRCFMFWNLQRFAQKPVLTAVVAGAAAEVKSIPVAAFCSHKVPRPCCGESDCVLSHLRIHHKTLPFALDSFDLRQAPSAFAYVYEWHC